MEVKKCINQTLGIHNTFIVPCGLEQQSVPTIYVYFTLYYRN